MRLILALCLSLLLFSCQTTGGNVVKSKSGISYEVTDLDHIPKDILRIYQKVAKQGYNRDDRDRTMFWVAMNKLPKAKQEAIIYFIKWDRLYLAGLRAATWHSLILSYKDRSPIITSEYKAYHHNASLFFESKLSSGKHPSYAKSFTYFGRKQVTKTHNKFINNTKAYARHDYSVKNALKSFKAEIRTKAALTALLIPLG